MSKLYVELKVGESLYIGNTVISLESKSGQRARLAINVDENLIITTPQKQRMSANEKEKHHG